MAFTRYTPHKQEHVVQEWWRKLSLHQHTSLTHETFLFLVCLIMAMRGGRYRDERSSPLLSRFQPHSLLRAQDCVGSGDGCGHSVALSHRSLFALQTCEPKLPALTKSSICQEEQTATPRRGGRLESFIRTSHKAKSQQHRKKYK